MQSPAIPDNEEERLGALRQLALLDTPAEQRFNRITRTAGRLFGAPIATVTLVDAERQWFKSRFGLQTSQTPRDISFCSHAILTDDILVVEDTLADPRFADNPLVTGPPHLRFYAGRPLRAAGGEKIGTLCVMDRQPRAFSAHDRLLLNDMGEWAERELSLNSEEHAARARFISLAQSLGGPVLVLDAQGRVETLNSAAAALFAQDAHLLTGQVADLLLSGPGDESLFAALGKTPPWSGPGILDVRLAGGDGRKLACTWNDYLSRGARHFTLLLGAPA